jgi:hypothetical protein
MESLRKFSSRLISNRLGRVSVVTATQLAQRISSVQWSSKNSELSAPAGKSNTQTGFRFNTLSSADRTIHGDVMSDQTGARLLAPCEVESLSGLATPVSTMIIQIWHFDFDRPIPVGRECSMVRLYFAPRKSTSVVSIVPAFRPGAVCEAQYRFVCAMTVSGGGAPQVV